MIVTIRPIMELRKPKIKRVNMSPLMCMAIAIFFEARGESIVGKEAVGQVIMNRVESDKFRDDVCSVVYRPHQFSFTSDGKSDDPKDYLSNPKEMKAWRQSILVAARVMNKDVDILPTSTYYHNTSVKPVWLEKFAFDGKVGNHLFYSDTGS